MGTVIICVIQPFFERDAARIGERRSGGPGAPKKFRLLLLAFLFILLYTALLAIRTLDSFHSMISGLQI